jgi:hypothetical protein
MTSDKLLFFCNRNLVLTSQTPTTLRQQNFLRPLPSTKGPIIENVGRRREKNADAARAHCLVGLEGHQF